MKPDLYCCIATYNEENSVLACLNSISKQDISGTLETIVCLNGCTDKTEAQVDAATRIHPELHIRKVHSRKGKAFAQNAIVKSIDHKDVPLAFIDADVTIERQCLRILQDELRRTSQLVAVGAWPVPYTPKDMTALESFFFQVLHVRAFHPMAEIARNDVSHFKGYVTTSPQPAVDPDFERRSKIYFHGRTFMLRDASFFHMPEDNEITDDTYLPNMIHTRYGPGTIRTRFDARANYRPYVTFGEHFQTYRRVFLDKARLDQKFAEFKDSRFYEQTRLDWSFILSQSPAVISRFVAYALIRDFEQICYCVMAKRPASELWHYEKK